MHSFEITIRRGSAEQPLVAVEYARGDDGFPLHREGSLQLAPDAATQLRALMGQPKEYGRLLGESLFRDGVRDAFVSALGATDSLRVLLTVEDAELQTYRWERLSAPFAAGWDHLALNQRSPFAFSLPSLADGLFPPIGRRDLKALILVARPEGQPEFDVPGTVAAVRDAFGALVPTEVLADGGDGPPTLDAMAERLTEGGHTLLHVVCHGLARGGESTLFLEKPDRTVDRVTDDRLLERLGKLKRPPYFAFLSACASAVPDAETPFSGIGQRLVRELGMPAVVAMTDRITIKTAGDLTTRFYARLREHGEPDLALVEAMAALVEEDDSLVPAVFYREPVRPLFDLVGRPVTRLSGAELGDGLGRLEAELPRRAPSLVPRLAEQAQTLRPLLAGDPTQLAEDLQAARTTAIDAIGALCLETLDLSFAALAQGQDPPAYDDRQPFRGLDPFRPEDHDLFSGRDDLVKRLQERLAEHPVLAVLGPSGSGKSSLVLAGLIPALEQSEPGLTWADFKPGSSPKAALDEVLTRLPNEGGVLVADQFEEAFTCCQDLVERSAFFDALLSQSGGRRVVLTMRGDFRGDCAAHAGLREVVEEHAESIVPMTTELRSAVEEQARRVSLRFDPELVSEVMEDVEDGPGAMPLLQQTLLELWQRRHGRLLKTTEYRALGRAKQVMVRAADAFYDGLSPAEQEQMRDIFIRLTWLNQDAKPGAERGDVSRPMPLDALILEGSDPAEVRRLTHRLAGAGLLVVP